MTWQPEIDELSGVGEHETVEGGVSAGHKSTLETAEDQESKRAALENYYKQFGSPFSTAETFNFDDLIDPRGHPAAHDPRPARRPGGEHCALGAEGAARHYAVKE